ncbi:uncharacterized protein SCHCODRAFT_02504705 [Schizophyllum commune H4-8]|uniref:Expressed protein n=1 Tax=Schizophyllum commune (strain H4-8 / FGSC 9210) TaxID=578458 RepID=D8Q695_SCHCM|nr:uncharacterized protein SCHCODRAFT_02504705 [Schizophyllum commune H4-8]KAI5891047.1 hypothetical protein SCHCODRAFT_02504705 [Schizophyllum commune H4-8]
MLRTKNLYIPLLACEFKRLLKLWTAAAATDQERLYLVAICIFIRLFNCRFPVFGLVTSGARGVLSCAYNEIIHVETKLDKKPPLEEYTPAIFIADQEAVQVDLRKPLDALNMATFIAYLVIVHAPRIQKLFESVSEVDDSVAEYLLDRRTKDLPTPLQIARKMGPADGKWHKQPPPRKDTKGAAKAQRKEATPSELDSIAEEIVDDE